MVAFIHKKIIISLSNIQHCKTLFIDRESVLISIYTKYEIMFLSLKRDV